MKQFWRFAPLLALLVVAVVVVLTLAWRERRYGWRPLPAGGAMRLLAIKQRGEESVELSERSLRERARLAWRLRSLGPITAEGRRIHAPRPGRLTLWFEGRSLPRERVARASAKLMMGGSVLPSVSAIIAGYDNEGKVAHLIFPFAELPAAAKTLRFHVDVNGATFDLTAPNPDYARDAVE